HLRGLAGGLRKLHHVHQAQRVRHQAGHLGHRQGGQAGRLPDRPALGDAGRAAPPLNIQTSEGYKVSVDISVLYRIVDPYKVITQVGPGRLYEDSLVIPRSEQTLRKSLGELDAENFYDVEKRLGRI